MIPLQLEKIRSRHRYRPRLAVFVLVASLLLSSCSLLGGTSTRQYDFNVGGSPLHVEAELDGGQVVATQPVGPPPDVPGMKFVAPPVHLAVEGGTLKRAKLTFPVDTAAIGLPPGVTDPTGALNILTRSEQTGDKWVWAGPGVFDMQTRTLNAEVTHFSDWTWAVTDFEAIEREKKLREQQEGIGFTIAKTIWGEKPLLNCPTDEIALGYDLKSVLSTRTHKPFDMCVTYDPEDKRYRVEIANTTHLPFRITAPEGLKFTPDAFTGRGIVSEAWAANNYLQTGRTILQPEGKLVGYADRDALKAGDTILAEFDGRSFVGDMGSFVTELALTHVDDKVKLSGDLQQVMQQKDFVDCVTKQGNEVEERLRTGDKKAFEERFAKLVESCFEDVTRRMFEESAKRGAGTFIGDMAGWFKGRLGMIWNIDDIMKSVREEIDGLMVISAQAFGGIENANVTIELMKPPPIKELYTALPPPPEGQDDLRQLEPIGLHFLLPDDCGIFEYGWFEEYPGQTGTAAVAVTGYRANGLNVYASLAKARSGHASSVKNYVSTLSRGKCSGHIFGYGSPPVTFDFRADDIGGEASRAYWRDEDQAAPPDGYTFIGISGEYLYYIVITVEGGVVTGSKDKSIAEARRVLGHLDLTLQTRFT